MVYVMQLLITSDFHEVKGKKKKQSISLPFLLPNFIA